MKAHVKCWLQQLQNNAAESSEQQGVLLEKNRRIKMTQLAIVQNGKGTFSPALKNNPTGTLSPFRLNSLRPSLSEKIVFRTDKGVARRT